MRRPEGQPVLTAAEMRAAEAVAIAGGATVDSLIIRAGREVAVAVARLAVGTPVLVLCGPGRNGCVGYAAAEELAAAGLTVRVAATGEPRTEIAMRARRLWRGPVEWSFDAQPASILVDALFGTGLSRPLDRNLQRDLHRLSYGKRFTVAVDLPSGVVTDDGTCLSTPVACDLTLAIGALKPAHVLQQSARYAGETRILDIGIAASSRSAMLYRPYLWPPGPGSHKYNRGMVAIVAGAMPGAAALAATAAAYAGAGYVLLLGSATDRLPHAIVRRRYDAALLEDPRIGALVIGPGLGRDERAKERLDAALASRASLVIDGDALHLLDDRRLDLLAQRRDPAILTPHSGEFDAVFGTGHGSKIDRTRAAAAHCGQTVVFKGADTIIADRDGFVSIATGSSSWLSSAGTGDVLAGTIAAILASYGRDTARAATAGVWLHAEAARRAGPAFLADDLARHLPKALSQCL